MSTQISSVVNITEAALAEFKRLMTDKQVPVGNGLRVGVKGGGCAGFSYILGFDNPTDQDESFELGGISVLVNRAHAMYLQGIEIDYHNGLDARGFVFNNPNATETCGCGTSFAS
jgi:iron-sulfur cluster assembly protein